MEKTRLKQGILSGALKLSQRQLKLVDCLENETKEKERQKSHFWTPRPPDHPSASCMVLITPGHDFYSLRGQVCSAVYNVLMLGNNRLHLQVAQIYTEQYRVICISLVPLFRFLYDKLHYRLPFIALCKSCPRLV